MDALDLVRLRPLMEATAGRPEIRIGLIDGPVFAGHPDLARESLRDLVPGSVCSGAACHHGTFVAGILAARRGSAAPALCPGCTLLVRPIFADGPGGGRGPSASPEELAAAILDCLSAGARVINLSVALSRLSAPGEAVLKDALDEAARRGVLVAAAAGNQGVVGSSVITRHPWVIPVVASDVQGRPLGWSNLGGSLGRRGLRAPGEDLASLGGGGGVHRLSGTSLSAPLVTGTLALLLSHFPAAPSAAVRLAVTRTGPRRGLIPPLLDAWASFQSLTRTSSQRRNAYGTHGNQ